MFAPTRLNGRPIGLDFASGTSRRNNQPFDPFRETGFKLGRGNAKQPCSSRDIADRAAVVVLPLARKTVICRLS